MEFGERVNTRVMATSGDDQGEPQRPDLLQRRCLNMLVDKEL